MRGTCLCGEVSFEIAGPMPRLYLCHCSLCRKQGGSASNASLVIHGENFRWIGGERRISSYERPTGFRSHFCSRCGSPVPNPLADTDYYWVPAGLLDGDAKLQVGAHLFVGSKAAWDAIPAGPPQYETSPELPELIELLYADTGV